MTTDYEEPEERIIHSEEAEQAYIDAMMEYYEASKQAE